LETGFLMKTFFTRNSGFFVIGIIAFIFIWKMISWSVSPNNLVPGPEDTFKTFVELTFARDSLPDLYNTVLRGLIGFALAFVLALILGLISGSRTAFYSFFNPFLVILRSTPVVAFILLLLIWFETDYVPVIIAFITMFPIVYTNITKGMQQVDPSLKEMIHVYQLTRAQRVRSVYLPSISAFLFSGAATALGFGWRAIIIGEVLSQPVYGIGTRMRESYAYFEVKEVISWTIMAVLLSYIFEMALSLMEKLAVKWKTA